MKILLNTIKMLTLLIVLGLLISPQSSIAQNTNTILILPFDVQADAEYTFLEPAVVDMLFTRLSAPGRTILVVEPKATLGLSRAESMTVADPIQSAQEKGADYVVTGRITLQNDTISTDAEFIGIGEQRTLVTFSQKGAQPGDIITQIDNFTSKVNADIFSPATSIGEQTPQADVPDDIHQHPEKIAIPDIPSDTSPENESTDLKESLLEQPNVNGR